ncbi:lysozyme inhibitor LprI family protein [Alphaproteobacteria bacterium]|jgi:uncharacterized protein YecT (DUF1311 family)|nr:lysozyme inhibitor LprI family protein [Alphaproteobacteria bacterium]
MIKNITTAVVAVSLVSLANFIMNQAEAASFSCSNPKTFATITICNDNGVSTLDSHLGTAYSKARSYHKSRGNNSDARAVRREQKDWIKARNVACNSSDRKAPRNYWPDQWQFDCFYNETRSRVESLIWELPKQKWPNYYYKWCSAYGFNC